MYACGRLLRSFFAAGLLIASISAAAAQIDTLAPPRGVPLSGLPGTGPTGTMPTDPISTGADANTYLGIGPPTEPFAPALPAGVVRTTEPTEYYVRLYTAGSSNPNGPWIMRASTVRGLTAEQLRDRFALPFLPTHITNVLVPSGTCLLSGIAGPITGSFPANPPAIPSPGPWGNGGAQQTYLIGHNTSDSCRFDFLVLGTNYINQRALGANALWYAPIVGPGNAGNVGGYLDHLPAPAEYSDLYNVYNTLDVLNGGTATRLAPALTELTGENHANAVWVALTNADRSVRTLSDHARTTLGEAQLVAPLANAMMSYAAVDAPGDRGRNAPGRWWAAGGALFGRVGGTSERSGYRFSGGQAMVGYDWRVPDWIVGTAVAVEMSDLTVEGASNSNTITALRGGGYGATTLVGFTFDASALLSWDHYVTSRDLPTFARSAAATYDGWSAGIAANVSRVFMAGKVHVEPLAGLSYIGLWRPGFAESGAGAVSLVADGETANKLASRLGATVSAPIALGDSVLRPWLRAYWAHDFLDSEGELTAAFAGATAPGTFTVVSATPGRDTALVGVGAEFVISAWAKAKIAYDGEWGRDASSHALTASATMRW